MSTPKKVQLAGGSTAAEDAYIGLVREVRIDTTRKEMRVHDGVTPGGFRIPNYDTLARLVGGAAYVIYTTNINDLSTADPGDGSKVYIVSSAVTGLDIRDNGGIYVYRAGAVPTYLRGLTIAAAGGGYWLNIVGQLGKGDNTVTDLNTIVTDGINAIDGAAGLNLPAAGASRWTVLTMRGNNGKRSSQIAFPIGVVIEPYYRVYAPSAWGAWQKFTIDGVTVDAYNAVGSYLFATNAGATTAPGATVAGSSLTPSAHDNASTGGARSGTWKAMGNGVTAKSTVWTRVS